MRATKKINLPAKASAYYTASALIGRGLGFLFTPIFTRLLSAQEYGAYSLYLNWLGILTIVSTLELSGGVYMRELQKSDERERTFRSALLSECIVIGAFCILYFAFYPVFYKITSLSILSSVFIFIQIFSTAAFNLYTASEKFAYRYKTVFILNAISGALPIPISILLIRLFGMGEYGRIIGMSAVYFALAIYIICTATKRERSISGKEVKRLILEGIVHFPHYLSLAVIARTDKLLLGAVYGKTALAKYSVADNVGSLILIAITAPLSALSPWILRRLSAGEVSRIREVVMQGARLLLWCALILLGAAPELLSLLAPEAYGEALFAAYPIALSAIPMFLFTVGSLTLTHAGRSFKSTLPSLIGAALAPVFAFILSRFPHFTAISLTQPASYIIMTLLLGILLRRRERAVFDTRGAILLILIGGISALSLFVMRDFAPLRLALTAVLFIPLLFEAGKCAALVKERKG